MTTPAVGVTHDVVLYFSDTIQCGLLVKPYTYRVNIAPQYIPRLGDPDPRGADKARWRSFIQNDFSGGSGLAVWDGLAGHNRYAISSFVGLDRKHIVRRAPGGEGASGGGTGFITEVCPVPTSAESGLSVAAKFFSDAFRGPFVLEMSGRPHMFQRGGAYLYTNQYPQSSVVWPPDPIRGVNHYLYLGKWVELLSYANKDIKAAVNFSNAIMLGKGLGIDVYAKGAITIPVYSTKTSALEVYDEKLWRGHKNYISYLEPADDSYDARWSDHIWVGAANHPVRKLKQFNGRLYIGKDDGLWIYDAGTVYQVEDFSDYTSRGNFVMMEDLFGAMYFNVKSAVYRLTSEGTLEKIDSPVQGHITGGCTAAGELIYSSYGHVNTEVWIFNPNTGASRKWFKTGEGPAPVPDPVHSGGFASPAALQGHVYIAPTMWTWGPWYYSVGAGYSASTAFPVVAAPRIAADDNDGYWNVERTGRSYLVTSRLSLGYPSLDKELNRVLVDFGGLEDEYETIDVYYYTGPEWFGSVAQAAASDEPYEWITDWTLLGTLLDTDTSPKALSFPAGTVCRYVLLKFVFRLPRGQTYYLPSINQYEIEYAPAPSDLKTYDFTIVADDNMELLNMEKEHSGAFIAATLYSCAVSPGTFVVGLPWPTKHTVRGLVTIVNPGGSVPAPVYDTTQFDGADIPVHVDEM